MVENGKVSPFGYLLIWHYIYSNQRPPTDVTLFSNVERFLVNTADAAHFIFNFYSLLNSQAPNPLNSAAYKWDKDLCNEYIEGDWQEAVTCVRSTFICNWLRKSHYKILYRLHMILVIMNKINPTFICEMPYRLRDLLSLLLGVQAHMQILEFFTAQEIIIKLKVKNDPGTFLLGLPLKTQIQSLKHYYFWPGNAFLISEWRTLPALLLRDFFCAPSWENASCAHRQWSIISGNMESSQRPHWKAKAPCGRALSWVSAPMIIWIISKDNFKTSGVCVLFSF